MPTIAASQRINTGQLHPTAPITAPVTGGSFAAAPAPIAAPVATPQEPVYRTSPLPIFASGTDRDTRQWSRPGFPQRRFLPIGLEGSL